MPSNDTPDIAQVSEKNTTGDLNPDIWDEAVAVTGRPQDTPAPNTTFADRANSTTDAAPVEDDQPVKKTAAKRTSKKK